MHRFLPSPAPHDRVPARWWWVALALLAARTAALLFSVRNPMPITGDEPLYEELAHNLLAGLGYFAKGEPWVWKPPGWPWVLAAAHTVFGPGRMGVVFVQSLFDAGTALLTAWVAWRVVGSRAAAAIAFAMVLAWPPFFRESRFMQTEPMFTLGVAATIAAFTRYTVAPSVSRAFLVGLAGAAATFVRPNGITVVAGLLIGWLLYRRGAARAEGPSLAALALGMLLLLGPWTIRNAVVFHTFIPVSTGAGELLFMGTTPETGGRWDHNKWDSLKDPAFAAERARLGRDLNRVDMDRAFLRAGLANWRKQPLTSLGLTCTRVLRLCFVPVGTADRWFVRIGFLAVLLALYALALPAGIAGLHATGRTAAVSGVLLVMVVLNIVAISTFYTNSRYFEPFRPVFMILASGSLATLLPWRRR